MRERNSNPQENKAAELQDEELNKVTGAGNPFENAPRVPEQPIDPSLREDA